MSNPSESEDLAQLAGVIALHVQVLSITLVRTYAEYKPSEDQEIKLQHGFKVSGHVEEVQETPEKTWERLDVMAGFSMKGVADGKEPELIVEATFRLQYKLGDSPYNEKHLDAFSKVNGIFNAWPYWREFVQSTVSRMGLPTLVLPVLTVGALRHLFKEQESKPSD
jgi:hypothetical protein